MTFDLVIAVWPSVRLETQDFAVTEEYWLKGLSSMICRMYNALTTSIVRFEAVNGEAIFNVERVISEAKQACTLRFVLIGINMMF